MDSRGQRYKENKLRKRNLKKIKVKSGREIRKRRGEGMKTGM
jgi:hypothetical protein